MSTEYPLTFITVNRVDRNPQLSPSRNDMFRSRNRIIFLRYANENSDRRVFAQGF